MTEPLRRIAKQTDESITVTVVAVTAGAASNEVLQFETIRLPTYQ